MDFQGKYNIYSLLTEYEHSFSNSVKLSAGARYSHVYNKDDSKENDISTFHNLHENRYALYAVGSFQWRKMTMSLGLRGERFNKRYHYTVQDVTRYKDWFFLPSFVFSCRLSDDLELSLSGNKKVSLPSFNELTPIVTYLNQYSYMIGNPLLKPTARYDFGIVLAWMDKFNAKLEYNVMKDDRAAIGVSDEEDAQVLKYTYANIFRPFVQASCHQSERGHLGAEREDSLLGSIFASHEAFLFRAALLQLEIGPGR